MPSGARVRFRPILRVPTTGWCGLAYRIANSDDMPLFSGNGLKPSQKKIEVLKYHKVKVTFSYLGKAALYFRPKGVPATLECTLELRHGVKGGCCRSLQNHCTAALVVENRLQSVKQRQALLESNLLRNSRLETHRSR